MTLLTTPRRFLSVNGKTLKKSMAHRGETTLSTVLFFEDLPFTDKNDAASLGVSRPLYLIEYLTCLLKDGPGRVLPKSRSRA